MSGSVFVIALFGAACQRVTPRTACDRDQDCGDGAMCLLDNGCAPTDLARRRGADVGNECQVVGGSEQGCGPGILCRLGYCQTGGGGNTSGCGQLDAPLFGGATDAQADGPTAVLVRWLPAADETPADQLDYLIFVATVAGGQDFTTPAVVVTGALSQSLGGLSAGATYYLVVRARDATGAMDCNINEVSATPQDLPTCVDYALWVQPIFDANCVRCHSGAQAPQGLHLDAYAGVMAGGLTGSEIISCQRGQSLLYMKVSLALPPVGERMPQGGPYLSDFEIDTIGQWIDQGAQASCPGDTARCNDTTPPTFVGLLSAALSATGVGADLCWSPAGDDTTAAADLVYDVYAAFEPGAEVFTAPPAATSTAGAACTSLEGLTPGQQYCWVVRARDANGNRDTNTVEHCLFIPAASCIEYASMVQPIFDANCIRCHSGANPPQNLDLTSMSGVMAGGLTGSAVIACQTNSSLLYQKISTDAPPVGVRMPYDGPPYLAQTQIDLIAQWIAQGTRATCLDSDPCSDGTPPTFAGLASAALSASGFGADLCWSAGSDDTTAPAALVYDVYAAFAPGSQDYLAPPARTSSAGATCVNIEGLTPGQEYCWVVRARDAAGNRDANALERCMTIPVASCIDYATMVQPIFDATCIRCHSGATPPRNLDLTSFTGLIAGGLTGNEVIACQATGSLVYQKVAMDPPPAGARMPYDGPPYLSQAQIDTLVQWLSEGARSDCAAPDPCNDATPPLFAGIESAGALDAADAELCWSPGSDDTTPAMDLVYDVYQATTPGAAATAPVRLTTPAGATCVSVSALSPGQPYCWVVRARDAAANRDANTVERCVTMPALPAGCVEYGTFVRPLFDANCVRCHSGPLPPQWLRLDTYDNVLAGSVRRREVDACDPGNSLLINKIGANPSIGGRMPLDGPPYLTAAQSGMLSQWVANGAQRTCGEASTCGDTTGPTFAGAVSATALDATTIEVCWSPATDDRTPAASIRYDIYEAATPGSEQFAQPAQQAVVGASCIRINIGPGTLLCFVVRARDLVGNADANRTEVCAMTPAVACAVEWSDVQPILDARCAHCHRGSAAPRFLDLTSYGGVLAGGSVRGEVRGCNWANSLINTKTAGPRCGRRMPWDGPPYLAPSERSLLQRWVETGARQSCTDPSPCGDTTPPTFLGLSTVTAIDPSTAELCWPAAGDDTTAQSSITYDIYEAGAPGGELYARPASFAAPAGSTCTQIPVAPGQRVCWVVRARDLAGNRDSNTVERCLTPPGACLDYESRVQPLFTARCVHCHSGPSAPNSVRWNTYANARSEVRPCDPSSGKLMEVSETCFMPYDTNVDTGTCRACLTPSQLDLLNEWIMQGANQSCPNGGCP